MKYVPLSLILIIYNSLLLSFSLKMYFTAWAKRRRLKKELRDRLESHHSNQSELNQKLFELLKFDQGILTELLSREPRQGHLIDSARLKVQEHTQNLLDLLWERLSPEQEAHLFQRVNEDLELCKRISRKNIINQAIIDQEKNDYTL